MSHAADEERAPRPLYDIADTQYEVAADTPDYAELHCVSNFSFLRGGSHAQELVAQAHALRYTALAITDECSLAGVVRAWEQAKTHPVQLIVGTELKLSDGPRFLLLAETLAGYSRISAAITRARMTLVDADDHSEDEDEETEPSANQSTPTVRPHVVKGRYQIDCKTFGEDWREVCAIWLPGPEPSAQEAAWMRARFGPCWFAIERHLDGDDGARIDTLLSLGQQQGLRPVACGDVHYHRPERRPLQDVLTALRLKTPLAQCGSALLSNGERHLRPRERIARLYDPAWIAESLVIARRCTFELKQLSYQYPKALMDVGETPASQLRKLTLQGVAKRWPQGCTDAIRQQIEKELDLIAYKNYEAFFLTVEEIVRFARSRHILCQGRGSAANSAVCYALGITEVTPEMGTLLFERFISVERDEAPDIDVDFEHQRREEVIQHVYGKYGRQHAALAATVIHYRTKMSLRDVGRALGIAPEVVDRLSNALSWWDGSEAIPTRLAELGFDIAAPQMRLWLNLARQLKGFPRHLSQHVGGFVIADGPVHELVPLENASMPDRSIIQWDKDDLESLGLLKVDVLALGMLSALRRSLEMVSKRRQQTMTLADIPREDPATYDMICRGETVGVFQIESRAQMSMLPRLQPRQFYDLVIQIAIVRPGPIQGGMVHPYLKRRMAHAKRIEEARRVGDTREISGLPIDMRPELNAALGRTFGVPIFQEQVMQIVSIAAGFSPGEADQVRRSMAAWKRTGGLEKYRDRLLAGMAKNGYTLEFAESIYQMILGFGSYGFPESHSASFANLCYFSCWLKHHEPACFIAGLLDSQPMGFYPPSMLVAEARRMGVTVRGVSVHASDWDSRVDEDGSAHGLLRLGFNRVSGFNEAAARRIMAARAQAPFVDADDLATRAALSRRELDLLAQADALRVLAGHRNQARWMSLGYTPQHDLLAGVSRLEAAVSLPKPAEGAQILGDYQSTGLTLRRHPAALLRPRLDKLKVVPASRIAQLPHGRRTQVAGITMFRQRPPTAKGVMFITLEDETGIVNLIVWAKVQEAYREAAVTGSFLIVGGEVQRQEGVTHFVAKRFTDCSDWVGDLPYLSRDFR
ncbi:MAG: error-prone DNA polymerase [Pseudomonadota bacterium]